MNEYRIASLARRDISESFRHIAKNNLPAAERWLLRLHDRLAMIARNPQMGELRAELAPELRVVSFGNYVIMFRAQDTNIEMVRLIHGARDLDTIFRQPKS